MTLPLPRATSWFGRLTIQARIALLVIACIVPASIAASFVIYLWYQQERAEIGKEVLTLARGMVRVVERDMAANVAALQTLAGLSTFDPAHPARFYHDAQKALGYSSGSTIVLTDSSGQQIMNLLQPLGSPLPRHGNPDVLRRVLESGRAVISDLYTGGVTKAPVLSIEIPVLVRGKPEYSLAMGILPSHLAELLRRQEIPPEWVVSIFDSTGTIVARSRNADRFVGQKGSQRLVQRMLEVPEGLIDEVPTLEGVPVMVAFSRSGDYGWTVAIGVPESILAGELKRALRWFAIGGSLLLLCGLILASVIGYSIAGPFTALIAPALDIGRGKAATIPRLALPEADAVAEALMNARQIIEQRERERDEAERGEREMLIAKEVAQQANETKARFVANVSHELRTPLNAILGFSRLLCNSPNLSAGQKHHLKIITRSGERLLGLINDVLEISKLESGREELKRSLFDMHELLHEVETLMSMQAAQKGIVFNCVLADDVPRCVIGDPTRVNQVLINLVGNSLKYTRHGSVFLRASLARRESPQQAWLRFEVKDTGSGIREEDRERIFSPFVHLAGTGQTEGGTGLGLAISKQYVELMGGEIDFQSVVGHGSVFCFEIPVGLPAGDANSAVHPRTVSRLADDDASFRLLIADDQEDSRLLLRQLLQPLDFSVREAVDGREALAVAEAWQPHLIWMDVRMPEIDGLEATRRIRAGKAGNDVKIIALTAHATAADRGDILAAGCDDFIAKPFHDSEIFAALSRHLGVRFVYTEARGACPAAAETAARLRQVQPSLLRALREAVVLLDVNRCVEAVRAIEPVDEGLAASLLAMIDDLKYKELLALLDDMLV